MTDRSKYRVGVIGTGRKGTQHARAYALNPRSEVVAAADPDPENLALFCERFGLTAGYDDYNEMLAKEQLDIVAPILPVSVNPEVVVACARAGVKAVLCEKPMSSSLEEADRMVEECRSHGVKFGAGDMFRNLPQLWKARRMIESGGIGDVQSISNFGSVGSGGGCQGLSVIRLFAGDADVDWTVGWVNGKPADETLGTLDASSDHDQGLGGVIRFANGVTAFIHDKALGRRGIEVVCSEGVFVSDYQAFHLLRPTGAEKRGGRRDLVEQEGVFEDSVGWGPFGEDGWQSMSDRQAASIQSIIDALDMDIEPRSSGDNGRTVLEMAIALRESERRGFSPVTVPLEDRSLKIIPAKSRLYYKKEVYGKEWYAEQMASHKRP